MRQHLSFLDIDMYCKSDGSLGHKIYHKSPNINLYLPLQNPTLRVFIAERSNVLGQERGSGPLKPRGEASS
jgi:hypothetical protein